MWGHIRPPCTIQPHITTMLLQARIYTFNKGALKLATAPLEKVTPQSKFFTIKYHWFRSKLDELGAQILGIRSNDQKADIFTKGLQKLNYQNIRKL